MDVVSIYVVELYSGAVYKTDQPDSTWVTLDKAVDDDNTFASKPTHPRNLDPAGALYIRLF